MTGSLQYLQPCFKIASPEEITKTNYSMSMTAQEKRCLGCRLSNGWFKRCTRALAIISLNTCVCLFLNHISALSF